MSGYDPMEELGASLEALETPLKRRITIAPPPTDDFTVEIDRPSTAPESVDELPVAAPAITSARAGAPASQRRGSGLVTRRPNGQMKSITASLPAHLVDRVTEMRLDAGVAGKSFKLTELLSTAVLDLPTKPTAVAAMVDRYASLSI